MHDALIMAGTAVVGGLLIDLQRRITARRQIQIGLPLIVVGWIMALAMCGTGPFPMQYGAAMGIGLLLTGVVLLVPSISKMMRTQRGAGSNRKA